jgi:hypothetical protein
MKTELPCNRRTFIKHAAIFGGIAALLCLRRPAEAGRAQATPVPPAEPTAAGYRLTEHVKRYYETARL